MSLAHQTWKSAHRRPAERLASAVAAILLLLVPFHAGQAQERSSGIQRVKTIGFWKRLKTAMGAQKLLGSELATHVQAHFPLEKVQEAIALYREKRTEGKVLLIP